jgi:hypothetical protein
MLQCIAQAGGSSRICGEGSAKTFSEGFLWTRRTITKEPPNAKEEDEPSSDAGKIGNGSSIAAMDTSIE